MTNRGGTIAGNGIQQGAIFFLELQGILGVIDKYNNKQQEAIMATSKQTTVVRAAGLIIKDSSPEDAVDFVRAIIEELNNHHGDSDMFEFATLYFP